MKSKAWIEAQKRAHTTHGGTHTRLYRIWQYMKKRCYNKNASNYERYGGRGIRVCDEWIHDFAAFRDWAMENGYQEDLSIDRVDNNGNYDPSNCRWETASEQGNNRRSTHVLVYKGEAHSIKEWSEITGIADSTIGNRLKAGLTVEETLTKPVRGHKEAMRNE